MHREKLAAVASSPATHPLVTWQGRLNEATSQDEVVALTREFLASLSPEDLRHIPEEVRPGPIDKAQHVTFYAMKLVHTELGGAPLGVRRVESFLTKAALRIFQIAEHQQQVSAEPKERCGD